MTHEYQVDKRWAVYVDGTRDQFSSNFYHSRFSAATTKPTWTPTVALFELDCARLHGDCTPRTRCQLWREIGARPRAAPLTKERPRRRAGPLAPTALQRCAHSP